MKENNPAIKIEDLSIGYRHKNDKKVIADGINLNLQTGKLISLIGANGVGKSTLLRTIAGLQDALDGKIAISGNDLKTLSHKEIAKNLSIVLTDKLPPGNLTVLELVSIGRQPYTNWVGSLSDADHQKIEDALTLTQTEELSNKRHFELSDGQLQKVMIARALAQDTPIIILDEPSTHLDLVHKVSLFRLLKSLAHDHQKCVLFSTHDIEMAIQASDEIIVMAAGSTTQETIDEFFKGSSFDRIFSDPSIIFDREKVKIVFKHL